MQACRTFLTVGNTIRALEVPLAIVRMREKYRSFKGTVDIVRKRTVGIAARRTEPNG
jgi:hypothetical protein